MGGLIIVGYPGVGKTSISKLYNGYVDLESSNFDFQDDVVQYCKVALNIAEQNKVVFVSSHKSVREYLNSIPFPENIKMIYLMPDFDMKEIWDWQLEMRYRSTGLEKDRKALVRCYENFGDDILDMKSDGVESIIISKEDFLFNLFERIEKKISKYIK